MPPSGSGLTLLTRVVQGTGEERLATWNSSWRLQEAGEGGGWQMGDGGGECECVISAESRSQVYDSGSWKRTEEGPPHARFPRVGGLNGH